jgi:hypothetical protein
MPTARGFRNTAVTPVKSGSDRLTARTGDPLSSSTKGRPTVPVAPVIRNINPPYDFEKIWKP